MKKLLEKIRRILRDRRTRKLLTRTVSVFAAIVVFVTTYALVLPAITMEAQADCGIEAHQHDASCYEDVLICEEEESDGHHHDDSCYTSSTDLECEIPEHSHDETCYDEEGNLICEQPEHKHDDTCYAEHRELTCGLEESDGHHHDSSCYEQVLACGKEVHVHSETCYHNGDAEAEEADAMAVMSDAAYTGASTRSADAAEGEEYEEATYGNENAGTGEVSSDAFSEDDSGADYTDEASSETADSDINNPDKTDTADTTDTSENISEDSYVPTIDPLTFEWILNNGTEIYYYHVKEDETVEDSSLITDWEKVDRNTELGRNDLLRVYLTYTIPAGSLNTTNETARYRLPFNLHLTDAQVKAINETENGIAGQFVNYDNLEVTDAENYHKYLGAEAVEGTRAPSENIDQYLAEHDNQEFISAVVKVENVYNDQNDYLGQDLIFTFTPYSVQKNQHEYDSTGQPTKAGETIKGWFTLDFNMEQVDWNESEITTYETSEEEVYDLPAEEAESAENAENTADDSDHISNRTKVITVERSEQTADVVFVSEGTDAQNNRIHEIHTELTLVEETKTERVETIAENTDPDEEAEKTGEETKDTSEEAQEETDQPDDAASDETAETAEPVDETSEELPDEKKEASSPEYKSGMLTSEGTGYKITLDYKADAQIPENAYLKVSEITRESDPEAYEACLKEAEKTIPTDNKTTVDDKASRFFDIEIFVDEQVNGRTADKTADQDHQDYEKPAEESAEEENTETVSRKIEPAAPVSVNIQLFDTEVSENVTDYNAEQYRVIHFAEEGTEEIQDVTAQTLDADQKQDDSANSNTTADTSALAPPTEVQFEAASFSIYGVIYTVDFHWEVDGKTYDFSIPGGGFVSFTDLVEVLGIAVSDPDGSLKNETGDSDEQDTAENVPLTLEEIIVSEDSRKFVADVESITFSSPDLLSVSKVEENTTVGAMKDGLGLECEYSAELTEEQIDRINAQTIEAGDWVLISLKPFDTEEILTVTMKNGDRFTVNVTDAHEVDTVGPGTIDPAKSYLICYEANGTYYLLKNDGSVDSSHNPNTFENLNSSYCWSFNYVFEEMHLEESLDYIYYLVRPIDQRAKTIALNSDDNDLIQRGNNNVAVIPADEGGFHIVGYNGVKLDFDNGEFFANELPADNYGITVHIYEMDTLPTYSYTARSSDEGRGTVTIAGGTQKTDGEGNYYEAESNSAKMNGGTITATPVDHRDGDGDNKWVFDHWTLDGVPLDRDQYPAQINTNSLPIPYNGSKLIAYFKQNKAYDVPDDEKQPTTLEDLTGWIDDLSNNPVPLEEGSTVKTAEVYDYENRIYRVDIESKSNFKTFHGNVDMAFCMDVSNSMFFPSSLIAHRDLQIYQINNSGWGWDNRSWLDRNRNWYNPYYLVADQSNTATVFKVYYQDGNWKAQDASRETETDRSFRIGDNFETSWAGSGNYPFNAGDNNNTTYTIYNAGNNGRNRFYYLNQALGSATTELKTIMDILDVAGDESPDVRVAYNTFNLNLGTQRQDFRTVEPITGINLANSHGGGTRPDQAFIDAQSFDWQGDDKYVILITDGAPQGKRDDDDFDNNFENISAYVEKQAGILRTYGGVKFITVGLSLDKVPHGKKLLYDLADEDKDGEKMFFMAEDASDLPNILRQVTKTIMDDAIVLAEVTDTVGEAFYPVDKATGLPLQPGDMIDLEGGLTDDPDLAAGVVQEDGMTVKWTDADIDSVTGWRGTLYVKAKEDLLGGNAVKTNDGAEVAAKKYRMGDKEYTFDESELGLKLKTLQIPFTSPRVNVNELVFPKESSEWTVYLGTEVDPESQLKKMYEDIIVTQVVNDDGSLHYPIVPNSIEDDRTGGEHGNAGTIHMAPMILDLIKEDSELAARYVDNNELNWDVFLTDIQRPGGVTVPYHAYGVEGDDSNIVITLTKEILDGEETDLVNESPHITTVVNGTGTDGSSIPAEKYVLTIQYNPDYDNVLPAGQGGKNPNAPAYGTGTFGSMYQGHAAGRETSTNTHEINVYNAPLDVYKTDENDNPLAGATFKLYRTDDENGEVIEGLDKGHKYVEVAAATSGNNGIARLKKNGEDFGLVLGEKYYLIETAAPANYTKVSTVWEVEVQTEIGKFTDLNGDPIYSTMTPPPPVGTGVTDNMYPFNWDQGARIMLDGKTPVTVIAKGDTEGSTVQITDGSFVSHEKAISFRHTVLNLGGLIDINVNKTWEDEEHKPASITVKLYRVSEKGHHWDEGRVVPSTCTEEGVKEYTCTECGKTDTYVISAAGHTPGTAHPENVVEATCTEPGSYDMVVRCTVCNAIISSEPASTEALGHTPGIPRTENRVEPTCTEAGGYDLVVRCIECNEIISTEHHTIHALGHDWGPWEVTTPAQPGVAGVETRVCRHDPSHVETRPIDPLPLAHTVRIYFRCTGNGNGGGNQYQITPIAERSGTGIGDMTIRWNWNQWTSPDNVTILVSGLEGTGASYNISRSGNNAGAQQTLVISNITRDLTVYVTFRNSNYAGTEDGLIGQPTFSGRRNAPSLSSVQGIRSAASALRTSLLSVDDPLRAGEDGDDSESPMAQEELTEYLESLVSKAEASCDEEDEEAVHTYIEEVGSYTITPDAGGNWSLPIEDLPKLNEYGNEYAYYVVETSPVYGYEITSTGQGSGLQNGGTAVINNKKLFGNLNVTKTVRVSGGSAEQNQFPAGTYTYPVVITTTIEGITYYVQDTQGTLGTAPPETPLTVTAGPLNTAGTALAIEHLPYGTYVVSEVQPDSVEVPGYSFVAAEIGTQGEIHFQSTTSGEGTVGETAGEVALENYYMRGASWTPEVDKWLNGTPYTSGLEGYNGFTFILSEPAGQNTIHGGSPAPGQPGNHILTAVTDESGKAVFGKIDYHLQGNQQNAQYSYTITEDRPTGAQNAPYIADDVQYDAKTIYVLVTVNRTGTGPNRVTEAHAAYYSDEAHTQPLSVVTFDNTELASLTVTKTVSGSYTPSVSDTFPITIKRGELFLNGSGVLVQTDPQLTIGPNQTLSFSNIPAGTYLVTEGDAERPRHSLTTTYTCRKGDQISEIQGVVLGKGDSGSVDIENIYTQAEVTIIKIDETTRDSAEQTRLPDAKFKLYKYFIPEGSSTGSYVIFPDATSCENTTNESGSLIFSGLTDGRYRIDETEAPDGYVTQEKLEIYFTVQHGIVIWTDASGNEINYQDLVTYEPEESTFTVGNTPGAALPSTGGPGTRLIYLFGLLLTVLAGTALVMKRRRRNTAR